MNSVPLAHLSLLGVLTALSPVVHAQQSRPSEPASEDSELPPEDPAVLPYVEGDPIPPGYVVEETGSTGLMIAGASVFALFYVPLVVDEPGNPYRWFPIAGPVDMLVRETTGAQCGGEDAPPCRASGGPGALFFLGQTLGAVLFIIGMPGNPDELHHVGQVTMTTVPVVSETSVGFVTVGAF